MTAHWYVLTTKPLMQDRADRELRKQGFKTFNPRIRLRHTKKDGSVRYSIAPYIRGYIFVKFDLDKDRWWVVKSTKGVARIISNLGMPCRVRRGLIESMLKAIGDNFAIDEKKLDDVIIRQGDEVEVLATGKTAKVLSVSLTRVSLMLEMFGRPMEVTANLSAIRKVEPKALVAA